MTLFSISDTPCGKQRGRDHAKDEDNTSPEKKRKGGAFGYGASSRELRMLDAIEFILSVGKSKTGGLN
jgi:hypothetical protein